MMNLRVKSIDLGVFWNDKGGDVGEGLGLGCPTSQLAVTVDWFECKVDVSELPLQKKFIALTPKKLIVCRECQTIADVLGQSDFFAWYNEFVTEAILKPGKIHEVNVVLVKSPRLPTKDATAELKIAATPSRAAVFVDGQFAGRVDEFDGVGSGSR